MNSRPATAVARIHILAGDDNVGREQARLKVLREIGSVHGQFTTEKYDSGVGDFSLFLQKMFTSSLFGEIRVFHINHAQLLGDSEIGELDRVLDLEIPEDVYIVVEIDEVKKGKEAESKTAKRLKASKRSSTKENNCAYLEFVKPPEYKTAQWIVQQSHQLFGRNIDKSDADYLVDLVGSDVDALYSELQKIDIHLESGEAIDRKTIEQVVGGSRQMTVFELAATLAGKDFNRALKIIDSLFETSFYAPMMISALFRQFWAMYRIRKFAEANPDQIKKFLNAKGYNNPVQNEIGYTIGRIAGLLREGEQRKVFPVIIASKIVEQTRKFSDEEFRLIFRWMLEFDAGVKTGAVDPSRTAVQMFCFKIARVSEILLSGNYS